VHRRGNLGLKYLMKQRSWDIMKISNRTRNEIIGSILESASGSSITMTEILYKTYLSHSLLKKYLSFLLERGLVEYETCKRTFKTTLTMLFCTFLYYYINMKNNLGLAQRRRHYSVYCSIIAKNIQITIRTNLQICN
jgi:predicted transcriptional regulator